MKLILILLSIIYSNQRLQLNYNDTKLCTSLNENECYMTEGCGFCSSGKCVPGNNNGPALGNGCPNNFNYKFTQIENNPYQFNPQYNQIEQSVYDPQGNIPIPSYIKPNNNKIMPIIAPNMVMTNRQPIVLNNQFSMQPAYNQNYGCNGFRDRQKCDNMNQCQWSDKTGCIYT